MSNFENYFFISNINADYTALAFEHEFPNEAYELISYKDFDEKLPKNIQIPIVHANPSNPSSHIIKRPVCLASNVEDEKIEDLVKRQFNGEIPCVNEAIAKDDDLARKNYEDTESKSLSELMKSEHEF